MIWRDGYQQGGDSAHVYFYDDAAGKPRAWHATGAPATRLLVRLTLKIGPGT